MLNALIIVFRESLEAMLVIGVLLAWIARQPAPAVLRRGLWLGVVAGIGVALELGFATFAAQSQMGGEALEQFQVGMVLFAAALIVQMVLWMHRHGRHIKRELEAQAGRAAGALGIGALGIGALGIGALGIGAVAALAVAREGAETVIFLYGLGLEGSGGDRVALLDDGSGAGRLLADFAGYRARPSASLLLTYAAFWLFALWRLRRSEKSTA